MPREDEPASIHREAVDNGIAAARAAADQHLRYFQHTISMYPDEILTALLNQIAALGFEVVAVTIVGYGSAPGGRLVYVFRSTHNST